MRISLVTYCYNDQNFVHGLLNYVKSFNLPLHEIIVADDCSERPYEPLGGETVVRQPGNLGPAWNKQAGLDAATGDILFSVDCDVRPATAWPRNALRHLADPQTGMVGCGVKPGLADNYLSRALYHLGKGAGHDHEVMFLPGAAWMMRASLWRNLGGFSGLEGRTHEDYLLSRKVREAGLKLIAADKFPVYESRRIHRLTYCRRQKAYLEGPYSAILRKHGPKKLFSDLDRELENILKDALMRDEWAMVYIYLLSLAFLLSALREENGFAPAGIIPSILQFFSGSPNLTAMFLQDLAALGANQSRPEKMAEFPWAARLFSRLASTSALEKLETAWVKKLRAEDEKAAEKFDLHFID